MENSPNRRRRPSEWDIEEDETFTLLRDDEIQTIGDALAEGARIETRMAEIERLLHSLGAIRPEELAALSQNGSQLLGSIAMRAASANTAFASAVRIQQEARSRAAEERVQAQVTRRLAEVEGLLTNYAGEIDDNHVCSICLSSFTSGECTNPCTITDSRCDCRPNTQLYGRGCISTWFRDQGTCPTCRNRLLPPRPSVRSRAVQPAINNTRRATLRTTRTTPRGGRPEAAPLTRRARYTQPPSPTAPVPLGRDPRADISSVMRAPSAVPALHPLRMHPVFNRPQPGPENPEVTPTAREGHQHTIVQTSHSSSPSSSESRTNELLAIAHRRQRVREEAERFRQAGERIDRELLLRGLDGTRFMTTPAWTRSIITQDEEQAMRVPPRVSPVPEPSIRVRIPTGAPEASTRVRLPTGAPVAREEARTASHVQRIMENTRQSELAELTNHNERAAAANRGINIAPSRRHFRRPSTNIPIENRSLWGMYGGNEVERLRSELTHLRGRRDDLYHQLRPDAEVPPRDSRQHLFTEELLELFTTSDQILNRLRPARSGDNVRLELSSNRQFGERIEHDDEVSPITTANESQINNDSNTTAPERYSPLSGPGHYEYVDTRPWVSDDDELDRDAQDGPDAQMDEVAQGLPGPPIYDSDENFDDALEEPGGSEDNDVEGSS